MSPIITLSLQVMNQSNAPAREGREVGALGGWTLGIAGRGAWETVGGPAALSQAHPLPGVGLWRWGPEAAEVEPLRD